MGVLREVLAGALLDRLLETLDQFLQIGRGQLRVEFDALGVLQIVHDLLERIDLVLVLRLQSEDDIAVHLHETAIAVPGEAFVAGLVDEAAQRGFVETDVEDGIHHTRHTFAGAGAARDEQRVFAVAELGPHRLLGLFEGRFDLGTEFGGILAVLGVLDADFGGDGETGRHGQADVGHLGEVGALAAEEVFHIGPALRLAAAEEVNGFLLCHAHRPHKGSATALAPSP